MDAVKLLTDDHRKVKQLLRKYEDVKDDLPAKRALAEQIIRELMVHERIEEDVFYPAYRNAADEEGKALVAESKEEHHVVDNLLDELQAVDLDDERFDAKFKVLKENVEHHIREEEGEMFPDARKLLGANKLNELGDVMAELKANMMREVAPKRGIEERRAVRAIFCGLKSSRGLPPVSAQLLATGILAHVEHLRQNPHFPRCLVRHVV